MPTFAPSFGLLVDPPLDNSENVVVLPALFYVSDEFHFDVGQPIGLCQGKQAKKQQQQLEWVPMQINAEHLGEEITH